MLNKATSLISTRRGTVKWAYTSGKSALLAIHANFCGCCDTEKGRLLLSKDAE